MVIMGHVAAAPGPYPVRVCPSERFLDPPVNFVDEQIIIYLALFRVRLG